MIYLHNLFENNIDNYMYRSGPEQNIKIFKPKIPQTSHDENFKEKAIYVSDDSSYAAGFCFDYSDKDGFDFGRTNNKQWNLSVPKEFKEKLNNKCSMYMLKKDNFIKLNISTPEYYSTNIEKVIKEKKFNSCYECLNYYNVKIKIT